MKKLLLIITITTLSVSSIQAMQELRFNITNKLLEETVTQYPFIEQQLKKSQQDFPVAPWPLLNWYSALDDSQKTIFQTWFLQETRSNQYVLLEYIFGPFTQQIINLLGENVIVFKAIFDNINNPVNLYSDVITRLKQNSSVPLMRWQEEYSGPASAKKATQFKLTQQPSITTPVMIQAIKKPQKWIPKPKPGPLGLLEPLTFRTQNLASKGIININNILNDLLRLSETESQNLIFNLMRYYAKQDENNKKIINHTFLECYNNLKKSQKTTIDKIIEKSRKTLHGPLVPVTCEKKPTINNFEELMTKKKTEIFEWYKSIDSDTHIEFTNWFLGQNRITQKKFITLILPNYMQSLCEQNNHTHNIFMQIFFNPMNPRKDVFLLDVQTKDIEQILNKEHLQENHKLNIPYQSSPNIKDLKQFSPSTQYSIDDFFTFTRNEKTASFQTDPAKKKYTNISDDKAKQIIEHLQKFTQQNPFLSKILQDNLKIDNIKKLINNSPKDTAAFMQWINGLNDDTKTLLFKLMFDTKEINPEKLTEYTHQINKTFNTQSSYWSKTKLTVGSAFALAMVSGGVTFKEQIQDAIKNAFLDTTIEVVKTIEPGYSFFKSVKEKVWNRTTHRSEKNNNIPLIPVEGGVIDLEPKGIGKSASTKTVPQPLVSTAIVESTTPQPSGTQTTAEPKNISAQDDTLLTGDAKPDSTPNNNAPATTPSNGITAPTSDEKSTTAMPTPPATQPATQPTSTQPKNVVSPKDTTGSDSTPKVNTSTTTPPGKKGDSTISAAYNKVASIVKKATTPFTNNQIITKHPHITKAVAVGVAAALGYTYYISSSEQDSAHDSEETKLA